MKRLLISICVFSISILAQAQNVDSIFTEARHAMRNGHYQKACSLYQDLYYNYAVKDYRRINSTYIEDLRKTYSIDELELENNIQRNRLLRFVWVGSFITILVVVGFIFYLRFQNKRMSLSKKELDKAKEIAEESIRNKSLLLSNMSHEIRTPLNALLGFSEILSMEDIDEDTRKQSNEIIRMNSELLLMLVNDIVNVSCADPANMTFHIQPCEVVSMGKSVVKMINAIKRTDADILFESDLKEFTLKTDLARLQQLLLNLIINATKFTKKGSITLKIEKTEEGKVLFSVTDTGCGIPLERQPYIFERFEKLHENVQGTGLGLSICKLISTRLGGEIWIDPGYMDGSRFVFVHPLDEKGGTS